MFPFLPWFILLGRWKVEIAKGHWLWVNHKKINIVPTIGIHRSDLDQGSDYIAILFCFFYCKFYVTKFEKWQCIQNLDMNPTYVIIFTRAVTHFQQPFSREISHKKFRGHWYPPFLISGDESCGFHSEGGFPYMVALDIFIDHRCTCVFKCVGNGFFQPFPRGNKFDIHPKFVQ